MDQLSCKPQSTTIWNALPLLVFPSTYWLLKQESVPSSETIHVFLRGFRYLFIERQYVHVDRGKTITVVDLFSYIEPILSKIPPHCFNMIISEGKSSDDPVLRSICHFFGSIQTAE